MRIELVGREDLTVESEGTIPLAQARSLVDPLRAEETRGDRAVVSLLLFRMSGMHARGLLGPRLAYGEALWRIGVDRDGERGWYADRCDLDHPLVRAFGRRLISYPVRHARFRFEETDAGCVVSVAAEGRRLEVRADVDESEPAVQTPRRVFTRQNGGRALREIPWREDPAPFRLMASLTWNDAGLARETFGDGVEWSSAQVLRGRIHRCGLARALEA